MKPKGPPDHVKWKKGQSGNPSGRPKADVVIADINRLSQRDLVEKLREFGNMTPSELQKTVWKDQKTTTFEVVCAKIYIDAMAGKADARQILLERLCGKVKDTLEISPTNARPMQTVAPEDLEKILSAPVIDVTPDEAEIVFDTDYGPMKPL